MNQTKEDYLGAMYKLEESKHQIKSVDVANYLNISKPSVSEMLRTLNKDGYINLKKYAPITLTKKGKKEAEKITARHRIIELFLKNVLKINNSKLHEEAHRLEHAFSDESIQKISKLLGNPKQDPHGKPIPKIM